LWLINELLSQIGLSGIAKKSGLAAKNSKVLEIIVLYSVVLSKGLGINPFQ
jgi:hypothetical protein